MKQVSLVLFGVVAGMVAYGMVSTSHGVPPKGDLKTAKAKVGTNPGNIYKGQMKPAGKDQLALLAGGCFWGLEDRMREVPGVVATAVGFSGGHVAKPSYELVCTGRTGHAETVLVEFDPTKITYSGVLKKFWEFINPTTLNRQGPDFGEQYRSAIFYLNDDQRVAALKSINEEQTHLHDKIVTEVTKATPFYLAEDYHQQYHIKTGTSACPIDRAH